MHAKEAFNTLISLILLMSAVWLLHGFIPALLWAVVIAIATWPLRTKVAKISRANDVAVSTIMTASIAVILFFPIIFTLIQAGTEFSALTSWILEVKRTGISVPDWLHKIPNVGDQSAKWWSANLADPADLSAFLENADSTWFRQFVQNLSSQAAHRLVTLLFTVLTLFFLYKNGEDLSKKILKLLEKLMGEVGTRYGLQAAMAIRATVNGVVLVGLGEGLLIGVSYWVAGVPLAAILGLMTGTLAMIPFAAQLIIIGISVVLMVQGKVIAAVGVFIFSMLILSLGDFIVRPKIIGGSVKLPFLWVLFGIIGGVEVLGLIGLFIGPTLMALVVMMWDDMTEANT
jgi:predicted PurR-regulated permease PerM